MKARLLFTFFCLFPIGCASTEEAMICARAMYVGQHIDKFILERGIPQEKHTLSNGDVVYWWTSDVEIVEMPETSHMSGHLDESGWYHGTATTTGGSKIRLFCKIRIITEKDGTVRDINAVRDTMGKWKSSRAAEIFKPPKPTS